MSCKEGIDKVKYQRISSPAVFGLTLQEVVETGLFGKPQSFSQGCWLVLKGTDYAFRLMYHYSQSSSCIMSKVWKNIAIDREVELVELGDILEFLPEDVQERIVFHLDLFR